MPNESEYAFPLVSARVAVPRQLLGVLTAYVPVAET